MLYLFHMDNLGNILNEIHEAEAKAQKIISYAKGVAAKISADADLEIARLQSDARNNGGNIAQPKSAELSTTSVVILDISPQKKSEAVAFVINEFNKVVAKNDN